jgi:hypothetical protein
MSGVRRSQPATFDARLKAAVAKAERPFCDLAENSTKYLCQLEDSDDFNWSLPSREAERLLLLNLKIIRA